MQEDSEHFDRLHEHSTLETMSVAHLVGQKNRALRAVRAASEQEKDKVLHPSWRDKRNVVGNLISSITGLATEDELVAEHKQMENLKVCDAGGTFKVK